MCHKFAIANKQKHIAKLNISKWTTTSHGPERNFQDSLSCIIYHNILGLFNVSMTLRLVFHIIQLLEVIEYNSKQ